MIYGEACSFIFNAKILQKEEYKYLGVILNSTKTATFSNKCGLLFLQTLQRLYFSASQKCASVGYLTPKVALQLFDSYVLPVLNYPSELWCKSVEIPCVERVQLHFINYVLGVKDSSCTTAVLGEIGRYPVCLSQFSKLIKYWVRIKLEKFLIS